MKKRVLEIVYGKVTNKPSGGLEVYASRLSSLIKENGYQVVFLNSMPEKYLEASDNVISYPSFEKSRLLNKLVYNCQIFLRRNDLARKFEIVHINGDNGSFIAGNRKTKTILTIHGSSWQHLLAILRSRALRVCDFPKIIGLAFSGFLELYAFRKADKVVCVSKYSLDFLNNFVNRQDAIIIPPSIDEPTPLNKVSKNTFEFEKYKLKVLWIGGDPIKKGLGISIQSIGEIPEASLTIVGDIQKPRNLPKNCYFLGRVDNVTLLKIYSSVDIIILPSMYEGFPTVLLEAMSYGVVPMTYNRPPFTEILSYENSYLVSNNSYIGFKDTVNSVIKSETQNLKGKSEKCSIKAKEFYNGMQFERYIKLIFELI